MSCLGYVLSGLWPVRVKSCLGYVLSGLWAVRVMSCPGYGSPGCGRPGCGCPGCGSPGCVLVPQGSPANGGIRDFNKIGLFLCHSHIEFRLRLS